MPTDELAAASVAKDETDTDDDEEAGAAAAAGAAAPENSAVAITKIEDMITIDRECYELNLNHGRIGKIEKLDELVNIERYARDNGNFP